MALAATQQWPVRPMDDLMNSIWRYAFCFYDKACLHDIFEEPSRGIEDQYLWGKTRGSACR